MADVVQYRMEKMLNELDDLERRGLFTRRELAEVVKQRRKFEYRLKRHSPLKQDFLDYIEYETRLDDLRRLRKKSVSRELKKLDAEGTKKGLKRSFSDASGLKRILDIYRLVVTRFKGDIDLWFRYLEFCRERSNGKMTKVMTQAIRFHPKVPGLWIYAAAWEFDHNMNVAAARVLMHSGLRVCPHSEDLWIEYLRMELTYLNKLKAVKVALGEDEGTLTRDKIDAEEKQWRDENEDLFMSINEESKETSEKTAEKMDMFRESGFNMLKTIYDEATKALPSSFSLRKRFLEILDAVDLPHTDEMRDQILQEMRANFSTDPEFWDWLARLEFDPENTGGMSEELVHSRAKKAIQVYEEALEALPASNVFIGYAKFLMGLIVSAKGETEVSSLSDGAAIYVPHLLGVYEKAESMSCITEELACQHVSLYLQLGRVEEARKLAEKLCQKLPDFINLWTMRVSIEARNVVKNPVSQTKSDLQSIYELIRSVLIKTPVKKAESLWLMAFKLFLSKKEYFEKLVETSILALARHGGSDDGFSLSSAIVNFVSQREGIQHARDMYKRFLALPHPGLAIYTNCIEMESNLASAGDKDGLARARKLYDSALTTYSQNANLWKNYHRLETKMGTSETASAVNWRARKILKDASALVSLDL